MKVMKMAPQLRRSGRGWKTRPLGENGGRHSHSTIVFQARRDRAHRVGTETVGPAPGLSPSGGNQTRGSVTNRIHGTVPFRTFWKIRQEPPEPVGVDDRLRAAAMLCKVFLADGYRE